jgi:hypothetical protein
MFPATKQLFRPLLLASLMLVLGQAPAFAQRRMMPMLMMPQMMPNSMTPSFTGLYGGSATPFATGSGNFSTFPSSNPLGAYGLGYGGLGYGGYGLGYGTGGYGAYGPGYGMAQTGGYGLPSSAAYADTPDYYSRSSKDSSSDLETALRDASSEADTLSNAEKVANLRKRLDKYLYLTSDGELKSR